MRPRRRQQRFMPNRLPLACRGVDHKRSCFVALLFAGLDWWNEIRSWLYHRSILVDLL